MVSFILLTLVSCFFFFSSSTVVNTHLTKEFRLNKDTYLKIEWAGVCKRALEGFSNYLLVEWM